MALCPAGHTSAADDFCDNCGLLISVPSRAQPAGPWGTSGQGRQDGYGPGNSPDGDAGTAGAGVAGSGCPNCGTPRTGRFCEGCGLDYNSGRLPGGGSALSPPTVAAPGSYDLQASSASPASPCMPDAPYAQPDAAGQPSWGAAWSAVVSADRTYYDNVRRASGPGAQGIDFPVYAAERRFSLAGAQMRIGRHSASRGLYPEIDLTGPPTDPGISRLHAVLIAQPDGGWAGRDPGSANGTMVNGAEIPVNQQVPLRDGDRINLGAWTAITVKNA
jgi:hypothetical protein